MTVVIMAARSLANSTLQDSIQEFRALLEPHADRLPFEVDRVEFSLCTDGLVLFCSVCSHHQKRPNRTITLQVLGSLHWWGGCSHLPGATSLSQAVVSSNLSQVCATILWIREVLSFRLAPSVQLIDSIDAVLSAGLAYATFHATVESRVIGSRTYNDIDPDIINRELAVVKERLSAVHHDLLTNASTREMLRREVRKHMRLSNDQTLGWVVLQYFPVRVLNNDLLRPSTLARVLQASYAPSTLFNAAVVHVPRWVERSIRVLLPGAIGSEFYPSLRSEDIEAALLLWNEAGDDVFADFDLCVAAALKLNK
jgi:hypothetical protein